jgi:hypothetical protein
LTPVKNISGKGVKGGEMAAPHILRFVRQSAEPPEALPSRHLDDVHFVTFRLRKITPDTRPNRFSWIP